MFASLEIGRPFGIRTAVHPTFWLLPAFVFLSGALGAGLDSAVFDTAVLLTLFGCVVMHELGHALAAKQYGIGTHDITLYPIGGVARLDRMPKSPWQEIGVALAGPAVNVVIAAFLAVVLTVHSDTLSVAGSTANDVERFLTSLLIGNVGLVLFNLIPAFPMDGGRVLRAVASMGMNRVAATKLAAGAGTLFAVILALWGLFGPFNPLFVVLAYFLYTVGQAEYAAVKDEEAGERYVRRRVPVAMPVWNTNAAVIEGWEYDADRHLWVYWQDGHPVRVHGGR